MKLTNYLAMVLLIAGTALFSCDNSNNASEEHIIVPPGKADDFLSKSAQEYVVSGTSTVTLESEYSGESYEERLQRAKELIEYKQVVIGWFLNSYLIDKSSHNSNEEYGGFKSLVKNGAFEDLEVTEIDELNFEFKFQQIIGGTNDLLNILPTEMDGEGKRFFILKMGKISNSEMARLDTNHEWYRSSPWSEFNPEEVAEDRLVDQKLYIWPEVRSDDAWLDYNRLFADGKVAMGVHFGWDYHDAYHIKHAEALYNWLVNTHDFTSPVDSFEEYERNSGPLSKTITANGKEVAIEISIYYGKTGTETDPDTASGGIVLEEDMRQSFAEREIIIYSGHSGYLYGFALANWKKTYEGDLDDSEIADMEMPSDLYQIVLAEGCDTYALGQSFFENPAKADHKNIDIITTTSFSNASTPETVQDFIEAVVGNSYSSNHEPQLYSELMQDMDSNSYWFNTMYGIHGIDDNPHLHPYANVGLLCTACESDSDCGEVGMQCSTLPNDNKVCTAECTADSGCPEGYSCELSATAGYLDKKQCVPLGYSCEDPDPEPSQKIMINEILFDPAPDLDGDANGDGYRHFAEDEFIEIINISSADLDLSSWTVADGYTVRFTFPQGATLAPGGAALIFGGGDPATFADFPGVEVYTAENGLGLNNSGDTITISDPEGKEREQVSYGSGSASDRSITRAADGDPEAGFIPHPEVPFSPGTRSDGSSF